LLRRQELEHEKQTYSISNQDLRRNIGDRDATAEQLLNKVMTLQLKLEEKMFAESMMARARQRSRSRIVAPVRSEKKSLWKRVFGQEKEQGVGEDEDDGSPAHGPSAVEAAAARAEAAEAAAVAGAGEQLKNSRSAEGLAARAGMSAADETYNLRVQQELKQKLAQEKKEKEQVRSSWGISGFFRAVIMFMRGVAQAAQAALDAREAAEHLESERESMMQLLKQKTESIRSLQVCGVWRIRLLFRAFLISVAVAAVRRVEGGRGRTTGAGAEGRAGHAEQEARRGGRQAAAEGRGFPGAYMRAGRQVPS
jgi:hypothetical protein